MITVSDYESTPVIVSYHADVMELDSTLLILTKIKHKIEIRSRHEYEFTYTLKHC
jgi:hypothetical protein